MGLSADLRIGIVAGEPSGDFLAAELIKAIRKNQPAVKVEGIGGKKLREAGCDILFPLEKLAVMGLVEVLGNIRELITIRRTIAKHFIRNPPDVFIGVDAPDFNLALERNLRKRGIKTIHYVSPTVWAWRTYRVQKIRQAVDLVLSVFPFEPNFFKQHAVPIKYVGHPLADQIDLKPDKEGACRRLGISPDRLTVAILPGSRRAELDRLLPPFIETAAWLHARHDGIQFVSNVLDDLAERQVIAQVEQRNLSNLHLKIFKNRMADVLASANVALLASGTVTLEALLHKVPMVVAYKMNSLTFWLVRKLVKVNFISLPNLLAGGKLVPEFFQSDCRADILGQGIQNWIDNPASIALLSEKFTELHESLRLNASENAAEAVMTVINRTEP